MFLFCLFFIEFVRELKGWDWLWEWLILKLLASLIFVSGIGYRGFEVFKGGVVNTILI